MKRLALVVLGLVAVLAALGLAVPSGSEATLVNEVKKLTASDAQAGDLFGRSVAVSGEIAVVGAYQGGAADAGAAYVFQKDAGGTDNWGQVKKLTASDAQAGDLFGSGVAVDEEIAVVGAHFEWGPGGMDSGAAYVFQRNAGGADNWGQVRKLTASDAQQSDSFGLSAAVNGDTAVVGAPGEDSGGSNSGAAYVFQRNAGGTDNWGQVRKLTASDAEAGDCLGVSVAASGEIAVVGAHHENSAGNQSGAAYVFSGSGPVGGIAEFPDIAGRSSHETSTGPEGSDSPAATYPALVGGLAAAIVAGTGGAWYARRRWLRRRA